MIGRDRPEIARSIYRPPWRIDLTVRPGVDQPIAAEAFVRLIVAALEAAGGPAPASIGLVLSNDAELATLNAEYMATTGPTDVLSFPLFPPEAFPPHPGRDDPPSRPDAPFPMPPGTRPHLGDIVISVERAAAQAGEGRGGQSSKITWDTASELRLLVVHGVLHICGWDHAQTEEEAAMRALERQLLG